MIYCLEPSVFFICIDFFYINIGEILQVNGRLTLGENIGDSAGVVAAYYAYQNTKTKLNNPEIRLQGFEEFSDNQIFFISFAHVRVMKCRDVYYMYICRCDMFKNLLNRQSLKSKIKVVIIVI